MFIHLILGCVTCHVQQHWIEKIHFQGNASHAFVGKEPLMLQSDHCTSFVQNHWKELEWEGKVGLKLWRWFVGGYPGSDYNRDPSLALCPGYPVPPKAAKHPSPRGQGCAFRPEVHLEGVVLSLKPTQCDGGGQEQKEQDTEACQGHPEEGETELSQAFLQSAACRNRGGKVHHVLAAGVTAASGPRELPRALPGVAEAESCPWAAVMFYCCQQFPENWRNNGLKVFLCPLMRLKADLGPEAAPSLPLFLVCPGHGTKSSCFLYHP